jgi:uncharacterized phosphosugar-binding protein
MTEIYVHEIEKLIQKLKSSQIPAIKLAAERITEAILASHLVYVFGTGQSGLMAYEVDHRAGGIQQFLPVLDQGLNMNSGAARSLGLERLPGYARIVIEDYDVQPGDVLIVVSNSGKNVVPIEMARVGKEKGATIVAITAREYSASLTSEEASGKRLFEVADVVLDSGCPPGDALVQLEGMSARIAASSTVMGALILNALVTQVGENLLKLGVVPAVAMSGKLPGAQEYNQKAIAPIRKKLRPHMRHG